MEIYTNPQMYNKILLDKLLPLIVFKAPWGHRSHFGNDCFREKKTLKCCQLYKMTPFLELN